MTTIGKNTGQVTQPQPRTEIQPPPQKNTAPAQASSQNTQQRDAFDGTQQAKKGPSLDGVGQVAVSGNTGGNPKLDGVDGAKGATYGRIPGGTPFVAGGGDSNPISPNDISQGALGDCYLMSSLATMAQQNPDAIKNMIQGPDKDGTYTVTLYDKKPIWQPWGDDFSKVEVKVTPDLPLKDGNPVFAQALDEQGGQREIWPALIEKAYAEHFGGNNYHSIEGGWGNEAMEHLTGKASSTANPKDLKFEQLQQMLSDGKGITLGSLNDLKLGPIDLPDSHDHNELYKNGTLICNHEYFVTGVDPKTKEVIVHNPWGWDRGDIRLPFDKFQSAFRQVSTNPLH
jgi:hypothetical protein